MGARLRFKSASMSESELIHIGAIALLEEVA